MTSLDPKTATMFVLVLLTAATCFFTSRRVVKHRRMLAVLHMELAAARRCLTDPAGPETPRDFTDTLDTAQIRMRQEPLAATNQAPEKYRYILSLAERGMDAPEIGATLNISITEVEQLLALSAVSHSRQDKKA